MSDDFQTAFPEYFEQETDEAFDRRMNQTETGEVLCQYGCGRPGQFFDAGPRGGELPRCTKLISDCPVVGRTAIRAAKLAGRLGRRR